MNTWFYNILPLPMSGMNNLRFRHILQGVADSFDLNVFLPSHILWQDRGNHAERPVSCMPLVYSVSGLRALHV